jgi:hypothetical protein
LFQFQPPRRLAFALALGSRAALGFMVVSAASAPASARDAASGAISLLGVTAIPDATSGAISITRGDGESTGITYGQFGLPFTVSQAFPLYLEGYLGYARYDPLYVFSDGQAERQMPGRLNHVTGTIGIGWDFRINRDLVLRPILNGAIGVVATDPALFGGLISARRDAELDVVTSGSTWATGWGGGLLLDYARYREAYEIDIELRYTLMTFATMERAEDGSRPTADAHTLGLWSRVRWPTGLEAFGRPVRWVAELSHSQFFGDQARVLGIDWLTKIGGGIEMDTGRVEATLAGFLYLNRIGLVGRYVFGRNVSGFSVGLSFGF